MAGTGNGWESPSSPNILQVNYYDDYRFLSIFTAHSDSLAYRVMNGYDNKYQGAGDAVSARGMLTGTATRVLNTSGNGGLLVRSMYYDLHGNLVQSHEQNHLGGYEHRYYQLTFTGKPLKVMHVHTTPDPLPEKYFHISPFANCANNPVNLIDVNGDSIAVLGYSKGEHIALLIQHEDRKWHYYSFNGTGIYLLTSGSLGGLPMHNLGEKPFDSVSDFLQREYNREGEDYERMNGTANGYGYDKALVFPTDEKQDNLVRETFLKVVAQGYNPLTNNCATAVSAAVQSIGIDTSIFVRGVFVPGFSIPLKLNALLPSSVYKAIKENTHILKK